MASRIAASATVRAVKGRKTLPTRAALVLVSHKYLLTLNDFLCPMKQIYNDFILILLFIYRR